MSNKKLLTLEQLVKFCEERNFSSFNSKENGYSLSVQVPGTFAIKEDLTEQGMLKIQLKVCHTLLNRNGSYISEENMKKAMPSLKYRPILAHIHKLDNDEYDFHSHDIEIYEDENGKEHVEYIEKQVGCYTSDEPYLEYDEAMDKTYVIANGVIPENYTMAADIIRRKKGTKVSCELCIDSFSYNAKEKYLELEDFYFSGTTLLGCEKNGKEIGEGMLGSRADIKDFSIENNSMRFEEKIDEKLIEILEKLDTTLSNFNINNTEEGGKQTVNFDELLKKYNVTAEDITFDYEGLTDEELEAKFEECFGKDDGSDEGEITPESDNEPDNEDNDDSDADNENGAENNESEDNGTEDVIPDTHSIQKKCSVSIDGVERTFELSLDDVQSALYTLVNDMYADADNTYYGVTVYDGYVIMHDYWNGRAYKQSYKREEDNFSLIGDREEVFANWLTADEENSLNEMRSNYTVIEEKLNKYVAKEVADNKKSLIASEDYVSIANKADFAELVKSVNEETDGLTFDELKEKADKLLLDYAKSGSLTLFSAHDPIRKPITRTALPIKTGKAKKSRYGAIFSQK